MKPRRTTLEAVRKPILGDPDKGCGYWVNVSTTDLITAKFKRAAKHLAVYLALNWTATDYKSRTIHVTHTHLSQLSGVSPAVVARCLDDLAAIGVVSVDKPKGMSGVIDELVKITLLGGIRLS